MPPQPVNSVTIPKDYAKAVARAAYIWGWPMANLFNRRATITQAPQPSLMNGVLPAAPQGQIAMLTDYIKPEQTFVACPNQDVVYGLGLFSLNKQPVVIQVPDFGDRFWVYAIYDARTDQFGKLGKQYGTKPGFYLLVGPNWKGEIPQGITEIIRSPTELGLIIPRVFMEETKEDRAAIQKMINQIVSYPLANFDGKMKMVDYSKIPTINTTSSNTNRGETKWVIPEKFFDQFKDILDNVSPLQGESSFYSQFYQLLNAAKKDPAIKQALIEAAQETEKEVIDSFIQWKHNGVPAGNSWNRSINNSNWGVDYFDRTGTAKSNIFENRQEETQYFYTDVDLNGSPLHGNNLYAITFLKGQTPPVKGFWSMTLYNQYHFFSPNNLNRYSLGTKNKNLKFNRDGSLTLYAGNASPGADKESNWLPAPEGTFSLYIRAYWGDKGILDGSWQPPKIEKINVPQ
ncbi:MAG: DUF1254 domain-containing protein [Proteobacteria bacterium]|nr:DUF1254 domain-containing protein [Pseudomonadota bacterium]